MNLVLVERVKVIVIVTLNAEEALYVEEIIVIADIFHRVLLIAAKNQVSSSIILYLLLLSLLFQASHLFSCNIITFHKYRMR